MLSICGGWSVGVTPDQAIATLKGIVFAAAVWAVDGVGVVTHSSAGRYTHEKVESYANASAGQ